MCLSEAQQVALTSKRVPVAYSGRARVAPRTAEISASASGVSRGAVPRGAVLGAVPVVVTVGLLGQQVGADGPDDRADEPDPGTHLGGVVAAALEGARSVEDVAQCQTGAAMPAAMVVSERPRC